MISKKIKTPVEVYQPKGMISWISYSDMFPVPKHDPDFTCQLFSSTQALYPSFISSKTKLF